MQNALLLTELHALRDQVTGVMESAVATVDGLLVAADTDGVQPEVVSALAAATLGLGKRTGHEVGMGELREVVIRCRGGYVVVYAVGQIALLAVLADEGLDVSRLHIESRPAVERLNTLLTQAQSRN
ncbi:roadblock/LC7 domain-containing protein [Acrocarpospora catenulata]|uniref:roadblock/LC7 domain-containing protein n=1 Tax=Acrocarpospora catenulata TaxID=2836182 RepID=UPI001BDAE4ED|nr:roadblock/LC7 domain-containing protein [Acrocarpospora catenulata]